MTTIRLLGASDAEAMAALRLRAYATDPEAFAGTPESDPSCDAGWVRKRLESQTIESGAVVIGAFAPALVGMLGLAREEPAKFAHKARLWGYYVEPASRGAGIGRALLAEAASVARQVHGIEQLTLRVCAACDAAIANYTRFGFEQFGREPRALKVGTTYFDELHLAAFLVS